MTQAGELSQQNKPKTAAAAAMNQICVQKGPLYVRKVNPPSLTVQTKYVGKFKAAAERQNQPSRQNTALDAAGDIKDTYRCFVLLHFRVDNVPISKITTMIIRNK